MKFLYIDDDRMDRKIFERTSSLLTEHEWVLCENFQEGLNLINQNNFDAIFIDGYLPDGNPDKLSEETSLPIIVLSGAEYGNSQGKFLQTLLKPIKEEELRKIVAQLSSPNSNYESASMENLSQISDGDTAFEIEMLEIYLAELPEEINAIQEFVDNLDFENAGRLAHKMKSKISLLSMYELREQANQIEHDCKNAIDLESIPSRVKNLCQRLNNSLAFAKAELNKRI